MGTKPPDEVNVGSNLKYEMDLEDGEISMDKILFPAMFYPLN